MGAEKSIKEIIDRLISRLYAHVHTRLTRISCEGAPISIAACVAGVI